MILPSKKVLSVFVLVAALVVAIIIAFGRDKSSQAINYASNLVAGEKISIPENPNWQKELGQTTANVEPIQTEEASTSGETITDAISRSFMSNFLAMQQSDSLDDTSAQKLIDQTIDYIGNSTNLNVETPKLNVIPDNGRQTIINYGENLGMILKTNKPQKVKNELIILQEAMDKKDPKKMEELQGITDFYEKIISEITKMPVPKTFVKAHSDVVVGMRAMTSGLREMKTVLSDPFRGLQGLQIYQEGSNLSSQATEAILNFIKQNKVIYKQGSGGYYLLYGL